MDPGNCDGASLSLFKLLSESKLGHFVVYLCELLHLDLVFADQVFFLLSKISKIVSWRARIDLAGRYGCALWDIGSSSYNGEAFDN